MSYDPSGRWKNRLSSSCDARVSYTGLGPWIVRATASPGAGPKVPQEILADLVARVSLPERVLGNLAM
jgi:hypothetical protein